MTRALLNSNDRNTATSKQVTTFWILLAKAQNDYVLLYLGIYIYYLFANILRWIGIHDKYRALYFLPPKSSCGSPGLFPTKVVEVEGKGPF